MLSSHSFTCKIDKDENHEGGIAIVCQYERDAKVKWDVEEDDHRDSRR
jgi:hypothetical protein